MAGKLGEINNCFLRIDTDISKLGDKGQNVPRGNTLNFTNMPPEVGSTKSANATPIPILGRANPLWVYSYSSERSWNLELRFFVTQQDTFTDLDPSSNNAAGVINSFDVRQQVLDKVNWCESLVYPIYIEGISRGIPKLLFVFGNMLSVKCICTDVNTSFSGPWYITSENTVGYPMYGIVNLTLKQIDGRSLSHLDVRGNKHNGEPV